MEKYNYVTLFNLNYLNRGLVLYDSLESVSQNFTLYVVCFDDPTFSILSSLKKKNLVPVSLKDFEDEKLLSVKPTRTATEYCWTCSASVIWYCMKKYKLENCAYIDADMYFYSDPAVLWEENKNAGVIITLHNYSPEYDQSEVSGKYCVQFVGFRNLPEANKVLEEWRENCISWCYNRAEDGKFGDQKYLDVWPGNYASVHVVNDPTASLAPWNIQQFKVRSASKVTRRNTGRTYKPVFFHFHKLRILQDDFVSFAPSYYRIGKKTLRVFYFPYAKQLLAVDDFLENNFPETYKPDYPIKPEIRFNVIKWLRHYLYFLLKDIRNIHPHKTNETFRIDYTYKVK